MTRIFGSSTSSIALGPKLGGGKEGTVFAVDGKNQLVAKVLHRPSPAAHDKVLAMISATPWALLKQNACILAWPLDILVEGQQKTFAGYLMPLCAGKRLNSYFDPKQNLLVADQDYALAVAVNLAHAVNLVHEAGHVIGDLSCFNVHAAPDHMVSLLDADSWQAKIGAKTMAWTGVARPDYEPPEMPKLRGPGKFLQPAQDRFSLAVLIFRLAMWGTHPFSAVVQHGGIHDRYARMKRGLWAYRSHGCPGYSPLPEAPPFDALPTHLQVLFRRAFEEGCLQPAARPTAAEWRAALGDARRRQRVVGRQQAAATTASVIPGNMVQARWPAVAACLLAGTVGFAGGLFAARDHLAFSLPGLSSRPQSAKHGLPVHTEPPPEAWLRLIGHSRQHGSAFGKRTENRESIEFTEPQPAAWRSLVDKQLP